MPTLKRMRSMADRRRAASWDSCDDGETAREIHHAEPDDWTGLWDHEGEPIFRPREPIGFNPYRWSKPMPNANQKKTYKTKKKGK